MITFLGIPQPPSEIVVDDFTAYPTRSRPPCWDNDGVDVLDGSNDTYFDVTFTSPVTFADGNPLVMSVYLYQNDTLPFGGSLYDSWELYANDCIWDAFNQVFTTHIPHKSPEIYSIRMQLYVAFSGASIVTPSGQPVSDDSWGFWIASPSINYCPS